MNKQTIRNDLIQNVIEIFKTDNVFLKWMTGVGKTKAMLTLCNQKKTLFVIEKLNQEQNVQDDAKKFGIDISNVIFTHYNSLKKYIDQPFDVICLDECDVITEERLKWLKQIEVKKYVLATAEINKEKLSLCKKICKFQIHKVDFSMALRYGILPEPEIRLLGINLPDEIRIDHFGKPLFCKGKDAFGKIQKEIDFYKPKVNKWSPPDFAAIKVLRLGLYRKQLFNKIKLQCIQQTFMDTFGEKTIFFFGNITDCPDWIPIYHSKDSSSKHNYETFLEGKSNLLGTVGMITRGINVPNIKNGVLMTFTKEPRDTIQKIGRILRSDNPVIWIPYVKGTDDERTIHNFLKTFNGTIIYV